MLGRDVNFNPVTALALVAGVVLLLLVLASVAPVFVAIGACLAVLLLLAVRRAGQSAGGKTPGR